MTDLIGGADVRPETTDPVLEREDLLGPPLFLFQDPGQAGDLGLDRQRGPVLEVAQLFCDTVLDVQHFTRKQGAVRVSGERQGVALPEAALPDGATLVRWDGQCWRARVRASWAVSLWEEDVVHSLAELRAAGRAEAVGHDLVEIPLPRMGRLHVEVGDVGLVVREVIPGRRVFGALLDSLDPTFLGISSFFGFAAALLGIAIATAPPPSEPDIVEVPDRFAEVMLATPEPEPTPKRELKQKQKADPDPGAKAKGKEGKRGKKDAKAERARGEAMARQQRDMEIVADAGMMGMLNDSGELSGILGSSALNADLTGGIGGLIGVKGDQIGSGGLSSRGSSFGGGGTAEGIGGLDTKGRGGGCLGCGQDGGVWGDGTKREGVVRTEGTPIYSQGLDKSLIDEVIKRHMNQIRYCYQRELNKDPNLSGKVTVFFVIAPDGSVSKARVKSSTLGSDAAEACITKRFHSFQFPEVKGGGIVMVSYPFMFSGT